MDSSCSSVQWYRRSKPLGKLKRRVQDLRIPSSCYYDFIANRPSQDLSHHESARLAVDCLLSRGLEAYHEVLNEEGEVDFLSDQEKNYIRENGRDADTIDPDASDDDDEDERELDSSSADSWSPTGSTDSVTVAGPDTRNIRDVKWRGPVLDESNVEVFFKPFCVKDLVREFISKAKMTLSIVMDCFTDVELLCDLLEASKKKNVSVHLLLDRLNLNLFISMWQDLKLNSKNFPKLSVREVDGQTYRAKTGVKLTGQIAESFIIADCNEVLTGSYSFSWLSWQVHRSLAVLLKGKAVSPFCEEFHRLCCIAKPVSGFVFEPPSLPSPTSPPVQNDNSHKKRLKSNENKTRRLMAWFEEAEAQLYPNPLVQLGNLQRAFVDQPKHAMRTVFPLYNLDTEVDPQAHNQVQNHPEALGQTHYSNIQSQLIGRTLSTTAEGAQTHGFQRSTCYQPLFKAKSDLDHQNVRPEVGLFHHRNRSSLKTPAVILNAERLQWRYQQQMNQHEDFKFDHTSAPLCPKPGFQFPLTHTRGHTSVLETIVPTLGTRRQNRSPIGSPSATESLGVTSAAGVTGAHLKAQLQTDSKLPQPLTSQQQQQQQQQLLTPSRLNWSHIARPLLRQSSFNSAYGTGQTASGQLGWRPFSSVRMTSLERTKSMTERNTPSPHASLTKS